MELSPEELKSVEYARSLRRAVEEKYKHLTLQEFSDQLELNTLERARAEGRILRAVGRDLKPLPEGWAEQRYQELKAAAEARAAKAAGIPSGGSGSGSGPADGTGGHQED
jgi:hypothetical protein